MTIKDDEYIQHWGIKGMKWDKDKKSDVKLLSEKQRLAKDHADATAIYGMKPFSSKTLGVGYVDINGNFYEGNATKALARKKKAITIAKEASKNPKEKSNVEKLEVGLQKARDAKKARDEAYKKSKRVSMTKSIKSISSNSVKKGKDFLDNLFSKGQKRTPANNIRRNNNLTPY